MTNPLSSFAHRTARWCALHPWRAILGWVALVAFAVGLATMIPTQETVDSDYRIGESGRADAMVADRRLRRPGHRAGADLRQDRPARRRAGQAGRRRGRGRDDRAPGRRRGRRAPGQPGRYGVPRLDPARSRPGRRGAAAGGDQGRAGRLPAARRPPVRRRQPRRGDQRPGRRRPVVGGDAQPPGDADPDAARVRCPDRGRHPGAARRHQRGRHGRHPGSGLAPDPRRLHRDQHDRADRHGGRRRLLALLPQAGARGARQGPLHPRRRRDRCADLGPLDPGLRRGRDLCDGRAVRDGRHDLQLAGRRFHHRGGGRGARLDHRAAGAAGQAGPLGGPPAGPAAAPRAAAYPARRHQWPRAGPGREAPARRRWPWPPWSWCCSPFRRWA